MIWALIFLAAGGLLAGKSKWLYQSGLWPWAGAQLNDREVNERNYIFMMRVVGVLWILIGIDGLTAALGR